MVGCNFQWLGESTEWAGRGLPGLSLQESCAIAKMTARCGGGRGGSWMVPFERALV